MGVGGWALGLGLGLGLGLKSGVEVRCIRVRVGSRGAVVLRAAYYYYSLRAASSCLSLWPGVITR